MENLARPARVYLRSGAVSRVLLVAAPPAAVVSLAPGDLSFSLVVHAVNSVN